MNFNKLGASVLAILLAVMFCLPASAMVITHWDKRWTEDGVGSFDKMEIFGLSPSSDFEAPVFANFTDDRNRLRKRINPDYTRATGYPKEVIFFNTLYNSNPTPPLIFDFLAWKGNTLAEHVQVKWENSDWSHTSLSAHEDPGYDRNPVPEPVTLLLLGSGLIGLAGLGRRKRIRHKAD